MDSLTYPTYFERMDLEIDALGLLCPLPVLRLRKRMMPLETGAKVRLLADDPAAIVDVPHFCNEAGHKLIDMVEQSGQFAFVVEKAPPPETDTGS